MNVKEVANEMKSKSNKVIIVKVDSFFVYYILRDGILINFYVENQNSVNVGDIYVCRINTYKPDIKGYFATIKAGIEVFLPENELNSPIKCGTEIPVRVKKEAFGNKRAVVSSIIELSGKYVVISNKEINSSFSKKLSNETRILLDNINTQNNVLFRTACANAELTDIENEYKQLSATLSDLIKKSEHSPLYTCLYKKDYLSKCKDNHLIDDSYEILEGNSDDLFTIYGLRSKLSNLITKKVWLKSGGYLFIEKTEALTVIDVNSGKSNYKKNKDEAALKLNIEAYKEISYQICARNISGMILVDFINMDNVETITMLTNEIKHHSTTHNDSLTLVDITKLGIFEFTRPKKEHDIYESLSMIDKTILL